MGYQTHAHVGKSLIKAEDIGNGQIELRHLSPALFTSVRMVELHNHSGVGSIPINLANLEGFFTLDGFKMVSSDGKKWKVTMGTDGQLDIVQIT